MQETGNSKPQSSKILSVRLSAYGLSFSIISPAGGGGERRIAFASDEKSQAEAVKNVIEAQPELSQEFTSVQVFLDTQNTVFVPAEVLGKGKPDPFLADAGIIVGPEEKAVISPAVEQLCAVIVFDAKTLKYIETRFGKRAAFFSPLQENLEIRGNLPMKDGGYIVNLTEKNLYITSFSGEGRLLLAEVYPYSTDADILYYMHRLTENSVRRRRFYLYGSRAAVKYRAVKRYFKGTACV